MSAARINACISGARYLKSYGLSIQLSASIGVAAAPEHGATAEALLAAADTAMYDVKYSGKDGVRLAAGAGVPAFT